MINFEGCAGLHKLPCLVSQRRCPKDRVSNSGLLENNREILITEAHLMFQLFVPWLLFVKRWQYRPRALYNGLEFIMNLNGQVQN
jgi:hypothetical protein